MTCIIGMLDKKGNPYIIGDSCYGEDTVGVYKSKKIFKVPDKDIIVGLAGYFRQIDLVKFTPEIFPDLPAGKEEYDLEYIVKDVVPRMLDMFEANGIGPDEEGDAKGTWVMVGVKNHIYNIYPHFDVVESRDNYDAMGSGEDHALASVFTSLKNGQTEVKQILITAMEATSYFVSSVQGPFFLIDIKGKIEEHDNTELLNAITETEIYQKLKKEDQVTFMKELKNKTKRHLATAQTNANEKLNRAIVKNDVNMVKEALNEGADVNYKNIHGDTALMREAIKRTHTNKEIIKLLMDAGADPLITNNANETALDYANPATKMYIESLMDHRNA